MSIPLNWDGTPMPERINADYIRQGCGTYGLHGDPERWYVRADIVDAKDAEIERLKAENDDMRVVMAALGKWRGHMTDNNYDAMCVAHAAYLRERVASGGNRPPDSGVRSGVQDPEEGGKSA